MNKYREEYVRKTKNALMSNRREQFVLAKFGEHYNDISSSVTPENSNEPRMSALRSSDHFGKSSMSGDSQRIATIDYASDTVRYTDAGDAFLCKQTLQSAQVGWCTVHGKIVAATKKSLWTYKDPYGVNHSGAMCRVNIIPQEILKARFPRYREICENLHKLRNALDAQTNTTDVNNAISESRKNLIQIQESDMQNNSQINEAYRRRRRECD
jgi:hypothetical protein